jgi:hypothetical protein
MKDYDGLFMNQWNYRHTHIMYCHFFNNTPYELIEQPRRGNNPTSYSLDKLKTEWEGMVDEVICDSA